MIILDCCAAVEMVQETSRGQAFEKLILENERVASSELFKAEVRNAYWKYVHMDIMTFEEAEERVAAAIGLVDEYIPLEDNAAESFAEAVRQNHSVCDMFYLTLARRNAATLFTADKKLVRLCERVGINCTCEVDF